MSSRLRVDLGAMKANYEIFNAAAAPGRAAGVVKADGYGLGAARVADALGSLGCQDLFVATASEAISLHASHPSARIFVFEGASDESALQLGRAGLVPVLNSPAQVRIWSDIAGDCPAAIHVDTGINRLGLGEEELTDDVIAGLNIVLLLTHLACADEPEHPMNRHQIEAFARVRARMPLTPVSIGNSAGTLLGGPFAGDLARPGIGLYGGNPYLSSPSPVKPVAFLEGRILQVRNLDAGEAVGYGATFVASEPMQIAIVGLGYADGLPRLLSGRGLAAVREERRRIVGRISMDLTAVDVTGLGVQPGEWVEFMGRTVTVDEVAAWAETIPYEVLTGLGHRPSRTYVD